MEDKIGGKNLKREKEKYWVIQKEILFSFSGK